MIVVSKRAHDGWRLCIEMPHLSTGRTFGGFGWGPPNGQTPLRFWPVGNLREIVTYHHSCVPLKNWMGVAL